MNETKTYIYDSEDVARKVKNTIVNLGFDCEQDGDSITCTENAYGFAMDSTYAPEAVEVTQ